MARVGDVVTYTPDAGVVWAGIVGRVNPDETVSLFVLEPNKPADWRENIPAADRVGGFQSLVAPVEPEPPPAESELAQPLADPEPAPVDVGDVLADPADV